MTPDETRFGARTPATPQEVARAIALMIRDMPRTPLDWTAEKLTDAEYRRLMREVAYTVWSCTDQDVEELIEEAPERIAKGGTLDDLELPRPRRRRWRWFTRTGEAR